jgi:hypothetical protein
MGIKPMAQNAVSSPLKASVFGSSVAVHFDSLDSNQEVSYQTPVPLG